MIKRNGLVILSVLVLTFFVVLAVGSGTEEEDVGRGENGEVATTEESEDKYTINETFTINGLDISIGDIEVRSDRILVGMTLNNETEDNMGLYPDQGNAVMGNMILSSNMFMSEGDLGGDIYAGTEKSGVIVFTAPEDREIPDEDEITLKLGDVRRGDIGDMDSTREEIDLTIPLK